MKETGSKRTLPPHKSVKHLVSDFSERLIALSRKEGGSCVAQCIIDACNVLNIDECNCVCESTGGSSRSVA